MSWGDKFISTLDKGAETSYNQTTGLIMEGLLVARRKKEPQNIHRKNISGAAEQLFMKMGIENTSMNDIAKESGYSKATLYVYFKNKEKEGFIRPPKSIKIESATGAGDAFSAAVLYGMAHGLEIDEIAALGMAASQIAMESEKAVNEKINIEDIKRRVTQNV